MRRVLLAAAVVLSLAALAAPIAGAGSPPRQSRQQAERNLLRATRMLARWKVGLVDRKTGLLLQGTTASCTGLGRPVAARYAAFRCVLHHGSHRIALRYVVLKDGGFEAHRL